MRSGRARCRRSRSTTARSSRGPSRTTAAASRSSSARPGRRRPARRALARPDRRRARDFVVEGDDDYEGIQGFFRRLERKKYKVHVRVFLSRYRGYLTCPDCGGTRLRREARDVRVGGQTIDAVCALTVQRRAACSSATLALSREGRGRRRQDPARNPAPARVPDRRRARLPDARSAVVDALGRRIAAHQPGDVARARRWSTRSTCSTSRRSACTRATTSG